jgi:WD40 repeat protein
LQTLLGHDDVVSALVVDKRDRLVSGSWDKTIRVWDLNRELP